MTTGLAILFFGWASVIAYVISIFQGQEAGDRFIMGVAEKFGPIVEGTLEWIFSNINI